MELKNSWGFTLSKISQSMDLQFSEELKSYGIDSRSYGILVALTEQDLVTQIKLAEILSVDRTTMGQLIDNLELNGFVERKQNTKDRRQNLILLTSAGKTLVNDMWLKMEKVELTTIDCLPDWQKNIILAIANRIEEN